MCTDRSEGYAAGSCPFGPPHVHGGRAGRRTAMGSEGAGRYEPVERQQEVVPVQAAEPDMFGGAVGALQHEVVEHLGRLAAFGAAHDREHPRHPLPDPAVPDLRSSAAASGTASSYARSTRTY